LASGGTVVAPLLQASRTVPIVFTLAPDPVGAGFLASLARPGGNATGFTGFEYGLSAKWLELLKEIAPRVPRAAILRDASIPQGVGQFAVAENGSRHTERPLLRCSRKTIFQSFTRTAVSCPSSFQ